MGSLILKKYSISLLSIINRVAIWMHFDLRVRIEGFKQHRPNQTSFNPHPLLPPPPPPPWEKFLPLCLVLSCLVLHNNNPAKSALLFFFFQSWIKIKRWIRGGSNQTSPDPESDMINIPPTFRTTTRNSHTSHLTTCKIPRKIDLLFTLETL